MKGARRLPLMTVAAVLALAAGAMAADYVSHPPTRPLHQPIDRPLPDGEKRFVDAARGDDKAAGTVERPWKTLTHAATQLTPGMTLVLRGGVYFEHPTITILAGADKPVTIRSYPGEVAIIDGGIPEFQTDPAANWQPCPDGVPGEFQSVQTYAELARGVDGVNVLGNFADSMVPLEGYRFRGDLQSSNPYWNIDDKSKKEQFVYCGPGIHLDAKTGRLHCRLAHTQMPWLGEDDNYHGETDPRKVALVIGAAGLGPALTVTDSNHLRLQDLVVRGAAGATVSVTNSCNVELDHLSMYGGGRVMQTSQLSGLRIQHSAFRGISAPWTYRAALKYRSVEARFFAAGGWQVSGGGEAGFEFAYCEFTDSIDGVFVGNVDGVRVHHCLMDNISDDGFFVTATTGYDGRTQGGDIHVSQSLLSRCLTAFAFGVGHGRQKITSQGRQLGRGVWIYRNVFDFRRPVMYFWPSSAGNEAAFADSIGRPGGDHGSPAWEPMFIYHNTFIAGDSSWRDHYLLGMGSVGMGKGTTRRLFNNIAVHARGKPGLVFPFDHIGSLDLHADYNLLWSLPEGEAQKDAFLATLHTGRFSRYFEASKQVYPPGHTANDKFADPRFTGLEADWKTVPDLRLEPASPAIDAGVRLPPDWPDPLAGQDSGLPDIGALPAGAQPPRVGVGGRLTIFGAPAAGEPVGPVTNWAFEDVAPPVIRDVKPAAVVEGYPAFEAPLITYALRRRSVPVDEIGRKWLDTAEFDRYSAIFYDGSFARGKIEPSKFSPEDLPRVESFLQKGGSLILMAGRTDMFASPHGAEFLARILGQSKRQPIENLQILEPRHPWVKHLATDLEYPWLTVKRTSPLRVTEGQNIIGSSNGGSVLFRRPVGKGQFIYVGWSIAGSLPASRDYASTDVTVEQNYEEQMQVLINIIEGLYP